MRMFTVNISKLRYAHFQIIKSVPLKCWRRIRPTVVYLYPVMILTLDRLVVILNGWLDDDP